MIGGLPDAKSCADACAYTSGCNSWSYLPIGLNTYGVALANSECYQKSKIYEESWKTTFNNITSGRKQCGTSKLPGMYERRMAFFGKSI